MHASVEEELEKDKPRSWSVVQVGRRCHLRLHVQCAPCSFLSYVAWAEKFGVFQCIAGFFYEGDSSPRAEISGHAMVCSINL